jgi:hypothetical protein
VLTRLFTPLFTVLLLVFLATMAWTGSPINVKREVLIGFDLLLVLVVGLWPTEAELRAQREFEQRLKESQARDREAAATPTTAATAQALRASQSSGAGAHARFDGGVPGSHRPVEPADASKLRPRSAQF